MNIRKNLNTKRKNRSNPRRGSFNRGNSFDSSKTVKPRGNAFQVLEKYLVLAQDANSNGDKIKAEGYYQYAEHYQRVINANGVRNNNETKNSSENNSDGTELSKNNNNPSRTERAINAKLKRLKKVSGEENYSNEVTKSDNPKKNEKTSDGVEALKAFATNIDPQ